MQEKLQQEIAQIRVEATAGGGMVTVKMDGQKNLLEVKIDPEVAGDVEMLQDMVVAACNEAVKKVDERDPAEDGRHAGRHGPAARVCSKRCPISPNRWPGSSTNSNACPASGRSPRSASRSTCCAPAAKTPNIWRRPFSTSRTSSASAAVCNNISDSDLCQLLPRSQPRSESGLRGGGAAQHRGHRNHAPVRRPLPRAARRALAAARHRPGVSSRSRAWWSASARAKFRK